MNLFDNESQILSFFIDSFMAEETALFPLGKELLELIQRITEESDCAKWVISSGKADPSPDFYCDEFAIMMEVMRVDDHAYKNRKGKVINSTNARESKVKNSAQGINAINSSHVECVSLLTYEGK